MKLYDLVNSVKSVQSVKPQAAAAGTINGAEVDARDAYAIMWLVEQGDEAGAPSARTIDVKVQDSDTSGGTFADAKDEANANVAITQITTNTAKVVELMDKLHANAKSGNRPSKSFRRAVAIVAFTGGTTPTVGLSVAALLVRRYLPS